jgi:hypothetical protein
MSALFTLCLAVMAFGVTAAEAFELSEEVWRWARR